MRIPVETEDHWEAAEVGNMTSPRRRERYPPPNTKAQEQEDLPIGKKRLLFYWTAFSICLYIATTLGSLAYCYFFVRLTTKADVLVFVRLHTLLVMATGLNWWAYRNRYYLIVMLLNFLPLLLAVLLHIQIPELLKVAGMKLHAF